MVAATRRAHRPITARAAPEDAGQWPWARIPIAETIDGEQP